MPESKPVLVVKLTTIYTSLQIPKNDTLPGIADATAELTMQIIQILTAKTLGIIPIKVNANKPSRLFAQLNYEV
jgi:hypothetical protein